MRSYECFALEDILDVRASRRGRKEGSLNTIHYVLLVQMSPAAGGQTIRILSTTNDFRGKKQLLAVRLFLGKDLDKQI